MSEVLAHWRATYAPGEWIVLSGPTSLVVLQPFATEWSALINTLWEEVLSSATIVDLAERLARHGLDEMPSFGAFFWTSDGMRSLVRGAVMVVDVATGQVVADGRGVQTWTEVGLGGVERIRVELPTAEEGGQMELPLVVGAVRASMVTLDAHPTHDLRSPQVAVAWPDPVTWSDPAGLTENGDTELMHPPLDAESDPELATARTWPETAPVQVPTAEPEPAPTRVPGIAMSDGRTVELAQPVRIGRAPSADVGGSVGHLLLVVSSPNQDISRTHLQIGLQNGEVVATDLHSTNGTLLQRPGSTGQPEQLDPGTAVAVPIGSRLDLGDGVSVVIEPSSSPPT